MKFQYISDLHLEFGNRVNIEPIADYLILAGDICKLNYKNEYYKFLNRISKKYKKVFIVSGNHEYYGQTIESGDSFIKDCMSKFNNIFYLNNDVYHFEDSNVSILGTTLWSYIPKNEYTLIQFNLNDYRLIKNFTPEICTNMFLDNCKFIENTLNNYSDRKFVVICHHVPQKRLINDKYKDSDINSSFASNVPILDKDQVIACVYGHTHIPSVSGKYYCNSFGYPRENIHDNVNKYFEI